MQPVNKQIFNLINNIW